MFEAHRFENFQWKNSATIKLQAYTNSSLKNQVVHRYFWSIYFRVKVSQNLFLKNLWVAASGMSCICFSFLLEFCKQNRRNSKNVAILSYVATFFLGWKSALSSDFTIFDILFYIPVIHSSLHIYNVVLFSDVEIEIADAIIS